MTQDAESTELIKQIREIWGNDLLGLRNALMGKTKVYHSKQAVYRWLNVTGIPKMYRRKLKNLIRERRLRELD